MAPSVDDAAADARWDGASVAVADGFSGSHLVEALLAVGADVRARATVAWVRERLDAFRFDEYAI